jgi:phosphoribosylaminoimidazole-succinocarboxamide synthase
VLFDFFLDKNLKLVDFKLEFGRDSKNQIILGDELNSDCMRLWDIDTGEILDKDVYRQNSSMNEVKETYEELYRRLFPDDKNM